MRHSRYSDEKELRASRTHKLEQAQALAFKPGGKISEADELEFDRLLSDIDRIDRELNDCMLSPQSVRVRAMLSSSNEPSSHEARAIRRAFDNYLKHGMQGLPEEDREYMQRRYAADPGFDIRAAQGVGSGGAGGYAVPDEAMRPLVEAMKLIGGVLPYATIVNSTTGADLPIPTDNETAVKGEIVNENTQHNEGDIVLSQVVLQSFLYSSKIVRVSIQLMDDAGFDFGAYVMRKLGERIGRVTAEHWVTGDGGSKPRGIATAASVGKTAASATAVTYDELVDLLHSVDPIYRAKGTWLMNDTTYAALRKLKDGQQRALYGDMAGDAPNMLLGHPISIDPNMPGMTASQKSILFGDLSTYYIRLVRAPRVLRLEERYADYLQLGFLGFLRADGDPIDGGGGSVKALQQA
jgi:HK97 family phage major capsid protein